MKKGLSTLCLALAAMTIGSCTNDDGILQNGQDNGGAINFIMSTGAASSRTSTGADATTNFVAGDKVGVFAEEGICANNEYTASGTDASSLVWSSLTPITLEKTPTAFYAYYPYAAANADKTQIGHAILTDQDNTDSYAQSDLLASVNTNPTYAEDGINKTVTLQFTHQLALVQVKVLLGEGTTAPRYVKLLNVLPKVSMDLTAQGGPAVTLDEAATKSEVFMYKYNEKLDGTENYINYRAVVPAQTIASADAILEFVVDDKIYKLTNASGVTYKKGMIRNISVQMGKEQPQLSINTDDIVPWDGSDTDGDIDGNAKPDGIAPAEIGEIPAITNETVINYNAENAFMWPADKNYKGWFLRSGANNVTVAENAIEDGAVKFSFSETKGSGLGLYYFLGACIKGETSRYKLSFKMKATGLNNTKCISSVFNMKQISAEEYEFSAFRPCPVKDTDVLTITAPMSFGVKFALLYGEDNNPDVWTDVSLEFDLSKQVTAAKSGVVEVQDWSANYDNLVIFVGDVKNGTPSIKDVKFEPVTETPAE